ncbi:hypothetical protein ACLGDE_06065 [Helicobacter pylori]
MEKYNDKIKEVLNEESKDSGNRDKFSKQSLHGRILPQKPKLILITIAPKNQRPMTSRKENGLNR